MTKDEVLQMALEALEYHTAQTRPIIETMATINVIKEALAQPTTGDYALGYAEGFNDACKKPEQEPVGWQWLDTANFRKKIPPAGESECWNPVYTSLPQREWVGLTNEDLDYLCHLAYSGDEEFALAVQAKLKEKNK